MGAEVIIVGAGLAGLCCARLLGRAGVTCEVLEASNQIGGRVATDLQDGFLLDRGFQVFLTSYPEGKSIVHDEPLGFRAFTPGALVRRNGKFHRFVDPLRRPLSAFSTALSPIATIGDKLKILKLRKQVMTGEAEALLDRPQSTTLEYLRAFGFSSGFIDSFFKPFYGGIFLENELSTSSRMFEYTFRMFATGDVVLPAAGMRAIPAQIAARLGPNVVVRTGARVKAVTDRTVTLATGEHFMGQAVVVAVPDHDALVDNDASRVGEREPWRGTTCVYFAAKRSPLKEPILVLNGDGTGPINNLCVPSDVAPSYAPPGHSLISATVLGAGELTGPDDTTLLDSVRDQLADWFGAEAKTWTHLRTYRIPKSLPAQSTGDLETVHRPAELPSGLFACGDHRDSASIQGAMLSGRRAGEAVLAKLRPRAV